MGVCPSGKWIETQEEAQGFSPASRENFTEGVVHKCPWAQRENPLAQWWLFNYLMSSDAVLTLFSDDPHRVKASWSCWGCWNLPHPMANPNPVYQIIYWENPQPAPVVLEPHWNPIVFFPIFLSLWAICRCIMWNMSRSCSSRVIQDSFPASAPYFQSITAHNRLFVTTDICIHKR